MKIFLILVFISFARGYNKEFDPIEFVASAKDEPQKYDFTLPENIATDDPYVLLKQVEGIQNEMNDLMKQIDPYLSHFDNTTGPELIQINSFVKTLNRTKIDLGVIDVRITNANNRLENITSSLDPLAFQLQCYQNSACNVATTTPTLPPAPDYNCSTVGTNQVVTEANQTGQFRIVSRLNFGNCNFTLRAQPNVGLYFNFTVTDFTAYGSGSSLTLIPDGSGESFPITGTQQINGIRTQVVDLVPSGELKFTINYIALDVCAGFDCGGGKCLAGQGNQPTCSCDSCYQPDENGKCTIHKPDACLTTDRCTRLDNGTCIPTSWNCDYYCQCPGVPNSCTTRKYCDPNDHTCPPASQSETSGFWNGLHD